MADASPKADTRSGPNYKKTLNLPTTAFPMRANLVQNEPASRTRWGAMDLVERIDAARASAEAFAFHDGPPYANGSLHAGHLLNKCLKDFVVRSRLMEGRRCRYVPGWDCHGLPIEHKVMTDLVTSGKIRKLEGLDDATRRIAVRKACREHAEKHIRIQMEQMQRLLTLADYEHPYLTMDPAYERRVIEVFATLVERGIVYRSLKPVHWSIDNRTALADAELEYEDRLDPSVHVDFEAASTSAVGKAFGVELDMRPSFMIWTTTPWTLPANLAIAVHERVRYALVRVDGNLTVLAKELVERVTKQAKSESVEIVAECDGRDLVGLEYRHPFIDRVSKVVAADYVTVEDGTGLVHTAPGHGVEDYQTGLREGLDVYCPVREDGTYDDTVPEWLHGKTVWEANELVTARLRESGHLYHHEMFTHSYPHDWRGRTPVIFRATEQWFVAVDRPLGPASDGAGGTGRSLRELAMEATDGTVRFTPGWGANRIRGMLESRPDWCLSRQRSWGLPIPAFRMPDGRVLLTAATVRSVAEAFGERGSDAWFTETPARLLATWDAAADPDAPAGADPATLEKMHDIFDVWFESGSSWNAVMRARGLGYPAELYLEGSDQHRGWFQLSLLPALGATGEPPFRHLLTHGFIVDKDGKKMSKSLGNALDVDEMLAAHGADVMRWWVSSVQYEHDVRLDESYLQAAGDGYRKVRNTIRFLLSNVDDLPEDEVRAAAAAQDEGGAGPEPSSIDAWVLGEAARVREQVLAGYEACDFRRVHQALFDFCNDTLSAVYCAATKDRLYCDRPDTPRRRSCQRTMLQLVRLVATLAAPILPHTADEAWRALPEAAGGGDGACVHERSFAGLPAAAPDAAWRTAMGLRTRALKALEEAKARGIENPLDAGLVWPDEGGAIAAAGIDAGDLADLCGVSRLRLDASASAIEVEDLSGEPRCERSWKRDGTVRERADGGMLSDRDAEAVGTA